MLHYNGHHYRNDFFTLAAQLPSWTFKEYGAGNRDEAVQPGHMPQAIRDSGFIWHIKNGGDGYGYNIHHATACGRPVIYRGCIVNGQTAGDVLEHMVTGIDLDRVDPHRLPEILEDWARWHDVKSEGVYRRFKQVIDFNNEFEQIKLFLDRLQ